MALEQMLPGGLAETYLNPEDLEYDENDEELASESEDEELLAQLRADMVGTKEDETLTERHFDSEVAELWDRWDEQGGTAQKALRALYGNCVLREYDVDMKVGRHLKLSFNLGSVLFEYEQVSQCEWDSAIWTCPKGGEFEQLPNLAATLRVLPGGEPIFVQRSFAPRYDLKKDVVWGPGLGGKTLREQCGLPEHEYSFADAPLLELLGVLCSDPEAAFFRPYLPFGLGPDSPKKRKVSPSKPKKSKAPEAKPGKDPRTSAIQRARGKKEAGA